MPATCWITTATCQLGNPPAYAGLGIYEKAWCLNISKAQSPVLQDLMAHRAWHVRAHRPLHVVTHRAGNEGSRARRQLMCDHEVIRQLHRLLLPLQRSRLLVSSILGTRMLLPGTGTSCMAIPMHISRSLLQIDLAWESSRSLAARCLACIRLGACLRCSPSDALLLLLLLLDTGQ